MAVYTDDEVKEWAKKALPADDFSNAKWEYRGDDLYYVSNIKDSMGKERTLNIQNRDRLGDPPVIIDAVTGQRYWPDVK
jgi:Tol biopolymer transport system component